MDNKDKKMRDKLIEVYPDGNVTNVTKLYFYREFNAIRIAKDIKLKKYITDILGLSYKAKTIHFTVDNVEENLLKFYPDKILDCITTIKDEHQLLYLAMHDYCDANNIDTVTYLTSIGFIIKNIDSETGTRINNRSNSIMNEDDSFIKKCLKELENIQSSGNNKDISITEKKKRNKKLVVKLKQLYKYTCQLCSNDNTGFQSPVIKRDNDNPYVEMHHIQGLANEIDESMDLDTYRNAIILCAHHHKYVHYHLGGFKELVRDSDNNLCLKSVHGVLLKININHHLKNQFTLVD